MHPDVRCYLAVPVAGTLELVETIFEGIFVVGAAKQNGWSNGLKGKECCLRLIVTLCDIHQIVDLVLEDLVVIILLTPPQVRIILNHILYALKGRPSVKLTQLTKQENHKPHTNRAK